MTPATLEIADPRMVEIPKTPPRTLETLPSDVIVEILGSMSSYTDLRYLFDAYPSFGNVFISFSKQIARQVAENMVGKDSWKLLTAVLIYQRERDLNRPKTHVDNFAALKQNIQSEFVFCVKDIRHIAFYNSLYESCSRRFVAYVSERYPRTPTSIGAGEKSEDPAAAPSLPVTHSPIFPPPHPPYYHCPFCPNRLPAPSFTAGDTLPPKLFYEVWVLYFQFTYDSHKAFSRRPPLSRQQVADLCLVSRVIDRSQTTRFHMVGERSNINPFIAEGFLTFQRLLEWRMCPPWEVIKNPLLLLKMLCHFVLKNPWLGNHTSNMEQHRSLRIFMVDFVVMSVKDMVEKYELFGGME